MQKKYRRKKNVALNEDPTDSGVLRLKGTLATANFKHSTKGRRDPQATIAWDVYKNGEVFIKAGTPVKLTMNRYGGNLEMTDFSTKSVSGDRVRLKRNFYYYGREQWNNVRTGLAITGFSMGILAPIGIPIMCGVGKYAHVKYSMEENEWIPPELDK